MAEGAHIAAGQDWLYRDQRTVKTPCTSHCRHTKLRAGDYLTVCVCVLLICSGGMSAPVGKPLWENPCGHKYERTNTDKVEERPTSEVLEPLLLVSKNALTKAQHFSEQWVGKIFHSPVMNHHKAWSSGGYEWLPSKEQLPKTLGESVSHQLLEEIIKKPLEHTLKLVHRNMQIYAVGLEQVHHDQVHYEDGWASHFRQMQIENKQVLCELETALLELNPRDQLETVDRDVMAPEFRHETSATSRNLRDWFILRDFMTTLEYIIELCDFVINIPKDKDDD